jgi:hypothetical protein
MLAAWATRAAQRRNSRFEYDFRRPILRGKKRDTDLAGTPK